MSCLHFAGRGLPQPPVEGVIHDTEALSRWKEEVCDLLRVGVPGWSAASPTGLAIAVVSGGITNALYRVSHPACEPGSVLLRLYGAGTEVIVDRDTDTRVLTYMGTLGIGARCYAVFANGRLEEYLPTRSLEPEEMGLPPPPQRTGVATVPPAVPGESGLRYGFAIAQRCADVHSLSYRDEWLDTAPGLWKVRGEGGGEGGRAASLVNHVFGSQHHAVALWVPPGRGGGGCGHGHAGTDRGRADGRDTP